MAEATVAEALRAFGLAANEKPRHPVLHGPAGTLVWFGLPDGKGHSVPVGVWIGPAGVRFVGPVPEAASAAQAHGLSGVSARLFELFLGAAREFLERTEEIDARLAETQERGRNVGLNDVWTLQRRVAVVRAEIGRALVGLAECAGRLSATFPGFADAAGTLEGELTRVQQLASSVRQSLSDLILLRNAEDANRIAASANDLSRMSNRIAALANISNIRMLGITYLAFVIALIGAAVLIPNTGATILGMPSAAWVPGLWVDLILVVLAIVPLVIVFTRPWVRSILRGLGPEEQRAAEGSSDLPEIPVASAERGSAPPPGATAEKRL
jgi:hypothetical protein